MASYSKIIDTIDNAAANYAAAVTEQEKQLFDEAVNLTHALETTSTGKIKCSLANINRLAKIKAALAKVAQSHPYLKAVAKLAKQMGNIQELQLEYYHKAFPEKAMSESVLEQAEAVKQIAVKYTIDGLTGAGIEANVLDGINKMLLKAVTTSESYAALTKELQKTLISTPGSASAFAKYANTYATTAMTQYAGQQNKLFTEDLGVHWFRYVGSTIETTRPICELLTAKEYIHISEIPGILEGKVDVGGEIKAVPIYEKTGLPYGMIEGTTKDNFQVNVGGWNCRHQLVPVADAAVPQILRDKFDEEAKAKAEAAAKAKAAAEAKAKAEAEKKAKEEAEKKAAEEAAAKAKAEAEAKAKAEAEKKAKEDAYKQFISDSKKYKDFDEAAALKALQEGDYASLDKIKMEMFDLQQQLQALDLLNDPITSAQSFGYEALLGVQKAVEAKLQQWAGMDNEKLIKKLEFEINYVKSKQKYETWQIAEKAYIKKLENVKLEVMMSDAMTSYKSLAQFSTKSAQYKDTLIKLEQALVAKDALQASALVNELLLKQASLINKRKGVGGKFTGKDEDYTQKRKDAALWAKSSKEADDKVRGEAGYVWRTSPTDEKDAIYGYTESYHNIQEPLRGITYFGSKEMTELGLKRIPLITDMIAKSKYDFDMWLQRGDTEISLKKFGLNTLNPTEEQIKALVGKEGIEPAFWSASTSKGKGFSSKPIIFNIYAPKGTRMMYCEPFSRYGLGSGRSWDGISPQKDFGYESEILIQRGTKMRVTKVEHSHGKWYIDVEILSQNPLPFPYVGGFPY